MAAIPPEVLPRFLVELPGLLAEVRRVSGVTASFNEAFSGKLLMRPVQGVEWTDDDKGEATVTVEIGDTGETVSATRKIVA
jgi:hypothetical protein